MKTVTLDDINTFTADYIAECQGITRMQGESNEHLMNRIFIEEFKKTAKRLDEKVGEMVRARKR